MFRRNNTIKKYSISGMVFAIVVFCLATPAFAEIYYDNPGTASSYSGTTYYDNPTIYYDNPGTATTYYDNRSTSYRPDIFDDINSYSNWYSLEDEGVYRRDLVVPYNTVYGIGGSNYGPDYYDDYYDSYYSGGASLYSYSAAYGYGGSSPYTQGSNAKAKTTTSKKPAKKTTTKAKTKPATKAQPTVKYVEPTPYITREKPSTESLVASVSPVVEEPVQQVVSYVHRAEYYPVVVPVQPQLNYVALTQIPYTGYDFGRFGNVFAWAAFLALIVSAGYLAYSLVTYLRFNFSWENPFRLY